MRREVDQLEAAEAPDLQRAGQIVALTKQVLGLTRTLERRDKARSAAAASERPVVRNGSVLTAEEVDFCSRVAAKLDAGRARNGAC